MTGLYKNKYRIDSARMKNWDYGWDAAYFITICTKGRECYFGQVEQGEMIQSEMGKIAHSLWLSIPEKFPFIDLDAFIVMPNHIHGILVIHNNVQTRLIASLQSHETQPKTVGGFAGMKNPMIQENISRVIRWYKGRCAFEIRKTLPCFDWQSRFHDHIIRDQMEMMRIRDYIVDNPKKWNEE